MINILLIAYKIYKSIKFIAEHKFLLNIISFHNFYLFILLCKSKSKKFSIFFIINKDFCIIY